MAYAVLVSLSQTIDEILNHGELSISHNQKEGIKSIHEHVIFLQAFLEDFPEKVNTVLEGKIMDVSSEAEDIIERFLWKKQYESSHGHCPHHYDLDELKRVANELDSIAAEAMNIKNRSVIKDIRTTTVVDSPAAATSSSSSSRLVAPSHKKEAMVGFDDDLLAIKERLCGESSKLQVIPIVGMGGIGKTTLATNVYLDPLIIEYFQIRAWVTVSQGYSKDKVLSDLVSSIKQSNTARPGQSNELNVYQTLKGRRYLIVMDDMWSTQAWDDVKRIFPDDGNGSRIMLTTRLSDVAAYADSSSRVHQMHLLDTDQSWTLLKHKVFTHEERCPLELESIGKEIARSCGGLPLAIAVIAGLLSTSKTRASWQNIADNVRPAISSTKDGHIEKVLSLSHTQLPHHLRPCLLYMGLFPEDDNIRVSKLIMLWVAEGFLKYAIGSKSYVEVAEEYLEDLVKRSLVLVNMRKSNGKIKSCSVHDLVRDLCIRKAKEARLFTLADKSIRGIDLESFKYQRRVYITCSNLIFLAHNGNSAERLRTIICFDSRSQVLGHLGNFKLLRTLDLLTYYVKSLPVKVLKLFRLRYLAFWSTEEIPADISDLQNLQTLIINPTKDAFYLYSRSDLVCLPLEIWKMRQLRHLVAPRSVLVPFVEEDTSTCGLENLVTLTISVDNVREGTVGMFKMIRNLKKLNISYFDDKFGTDNYHRDELVHLHQLENLTLNHVGSRRGKFEPAFPKTLKKLTLTAWDGDVMRNVGSLPNLQVLKLRRWAFDGQTWETREGEFSQLKFLLIEDWNLKQWITESSHFPTLKCLLLHHCWDLEEIPDGIGEIQTLELIDIKGYKRSLVDSAKRIQEEQQDLGNNALQVRCIDW